MQRQRDIVGDLATHRNDDAALVLEVGDVADALLGQLLKVQPVGAVKVGRYRFRVGVDHNGWFLMLAQSAGGVDGAPVKLHRRADAVGSGAKDNNRVARQRRDVVLGAVVGGVEVVGFGVELTGQ